jgi:type IV pilus assembly protein PilM
MDFLPTTLGTRPRLAIEIGAEGVVAARAEDAAASLTAVSRMKLLAGDVVPGLKAGNVMDRTAVVAAVKSALDSVSGRGAGPNAGRSRDVTVVVPDAAARVLLLDFDSLPSKAVEAMPVVRFRLKKLLPFDADDAALSYQIMSSSKSGAQVLAVAMPREVLTEYEGVVAAAGYLPGAVLPSTLAALAGLDEADSAVLVVNAGLGQLTAAIVRAGVLLLHRTIDISADSVAPALVAAAAAAHGEYGHHEAVLESAEITHIAAGRADVSIVGHEVAQAVSVAAAYFEDTLSSAPQVLLSAGTTGAETLRRMLTENGLEELRVKELVEPAMIDASAVSASVPRGWLAGVRGALKG